MADKKVTEAVEEAVPEEISTSSIMQELLTEVKRLRDEQAQSEARFKADLDAARAEALQAAVDQFAPKPMADWIDPRTDHPATLEVKLDAMERQAKENGTTFDRERTSRILRGLPVEDLNKFKYMGRAFDSQEEMEAYRDKVEQERERTVGRYPR